MSPPLFLLFILYLLTFITPPTGGDQCERKFRGFGSYIGKMGSFNESSPELTRLVLDTLYNDLRLRLFRTEYPSKFSLKPYEYKIDCIDYLTCSWINVHHMLRDYRDIELFATIWSPPQYMKNENSGFLDKWTWPYYWYIKNITEKISKDFKLEIAPISIANEPESPFATWDHCTMSARQLCSMVKNFADKNLKLCPENSYFWITKTYLSYSDENVSCLDECETIVTHGYQLNLFGENSLQVYYDTTENTHTLTAPIWMTEISSTYSGANVTQMKEAIDLARSIVSFVGRTCVERFYYWYSYLTLPTGEALIWGNGDGSGIFLPKKYYAYRHFTRSVRPEGSSVKMCSSSTYLCIQFDERPVFVNRRKRAATLPAPLKLCCTTEAENLLCSDYVKLPPKSICSPVETQT